MLFLVFELPNRFIASGSRHAAVIFECPEPREFSPQPAERLHPLAEDERLLPTGMDLLEIDDALRALEGADPRASKVVEARIFGGLSIEEAAEALGLSLSTVSRDWRFGRAFLAGQLSQDGDSPTADEEAAS